MRARALGALVALVSCLLAAPPAAAGNATHINLDVPLGYTLSGVLRDQAGQPVEGATVFVSGDREPESGRPGADGAFLVSGIAPGRHTIEIDVDGDSLVSGFYAGVLPGHFTPDAAAAEAVLFDGDIGGLEVTLPAGFSISGRVRSASGPLAQINVQAIPAPGEEWSLHARSTLTDAAGDFSLQGLAPGAYVLALTSDKRVSTTSTARYIDGFYAAAAAGHLAPSRAQATALDVGPDIIGVAITLRPGFSISGLLTRPNGTPLRSTFVFPVGGPTTSHVAFTGTSGRFAVRGLAPGAYRLRIQPDNMEVGPAGWYTNRTASHFTRSAAKATWVTVSHDRSHVDATLPRTYTISGTVRNAAGAPVRYAGVFAGGSGATTDAKGRYTIRGLLAGHYRVEVRPSEVSNLQAGWYRAASPGSHFTVSSAAATLVAVGPSRIGINLRLPTGFTISGCVGIPGTTFVEVFAEGMGRFFSSRTSAAGCYRVIGLAPGRYTIRVNADAPWADGYYSALALFHYTPTRTGATPIIVGP